MYEFIYTDEYINTVVNTLHSLKVDRKTLSYCYVIIVKNDEIYLTHGIFWEWEYSRSLLGGYRLVVQSIYMWCMR